MTACWFLCLVGTRPSAAHAASSPDDSLATVTERTMGPPHPPLFTKADLAFGTLALGLTGVASTQDAWLTEESREANTQGERRLAGLSRPLGSGALVLGALAVTYGVGRLARDDRLAAGTTRIGAAVLASGVCAQAIKFSVGRARPASSPGDVDQFAPFQGDESFPSGHTAVAFALAHAIDHETHARWVPFVVYPVAAAVGWSRVRDNRHWTSDVVGGAMLGVWVSCKTERLFHH